MKPDPKSPATVMPQYSHMLPGWEKIQTVLDGTRAMREAGHTYLPQHDRETDRAYRERLAVCTLLNMTKLTLDSWVGRPFSEPLKLKDDVPAEILALTEDIDMIGSSINVFARNWFREGMAKAYSHVLVDMPRTVPRGDGLPRTLEDDRRDGVRPYWVHILPEQLFFAHSDMFGGKERLLEIRYEETVTQMQGFALVSAPQIKRLYLNGEGTVSVEVYQLVSDNARKPRWAKVDEWIMDIDRIPLVTFYADRSGFMLGKSPLEDLADLNIAHWQSTSDQRAILTVARFPILACSGGSDETGELVIGPNRSLYIPDPQGRFYYVEHTGAAIASGDADLAELARQMGEYGSEWLKKRPNRETATARSLDTAEATSALQDATLRFQDALERALQMTARWLRIESAGSVAVYNDFSLPAAGGETLRILIEARKNRDISREAFLIELKRAGILDEDFNSETDAARLEKELMDMFPVDTGEPVVDDGSE